MRKIYMLGIAAIALSFSMNAQIIFEDDMESYPLGPLAQGHWDSWEGLPQERIIITEAQARSGTKSGLIGGDNTQDAVLKLGDETSGTFTVRWSMYVPSGKTGYYNFQEQEDPGNGAWAINVHFNFQNTSPGMASLTDDSNPAVEVATFAYPEDTWFTLNHVIDLDADTVTLELDGNVVYDGAFYSGGNLGGVDFFSISANNEYYLDDIVFGDGVLGISDITNDSFSIYPNPVANILNIRAKTNIENVALYDALGKLVLSVNPGLMSHQIDMSSLTSGMYFVKISSGNTSQTFKVIK